MHLVCDGKGRPLSTHLTPGQRHDSTQLEPLLDTIRVMRPTGGQLKNARIGSLPTGGIATRVAGIFFDGEASHTRYRNGAINVSAEANDPVPLYPSIVICTRSEMLPNGASID
ncbi:hypothetical protein GCM10011571_20720 [Marinithermofilum abyssi]|uniref:Transposase IS4-like domain-containing protein n=1 Tax=Marinithermofilum abyssi TaxID=1571185 RepID=A0A8J2YE72_9BACL|nr:hypothetical protein GCM10011571_20720 [Marinithermofilum abyssi]